jgi:hypothetical protein
VLIYCERPVQIPDVTPSRLVDFWVRTRDGERLCVVLRPAELTSAALGHLLFPAFESWSMASSMQLHLVDPQELDDRPTLRQNRVTMLHHLAGTHSLPVEPLMCGVTAACRHGSTLAELELRLAPADPMLVRSAAKSVVRHWRLSRSALIPVWSWYEIDRFWRVAIRSSFDTARTEARRRMATR